MDFYLSPSLLTDETAWELCDVLCVCDPCSEPLWLRLERWLSQHAARRLIVLDPAPQGRRALHLQERRVRYCDEETLRALSWELVFLRFGYVPGGQQEEIAKFSWVEHYRQGVALLASDTQDLGVRVVSNAMRNVQMLPHSLFGPALKGSCSGLTAVVCGAGPSLDACIPHLRGLEEKALLIAGGSALGALRTHGIRPHIAACLDPDPDPHRYPPQEIDAMALFYQSRLSSSFLNQVRVPLVWMPSTGNYPLELDLAAACGFASASFDAGWTVSNFAIALALHLGCNRILLCGIDCSCGPQEIYATSMSGPEHSGQLMELEKGTLYSRTDWLMSAAWIRSQVASRPDVEWINTSPPAEALLQLKAISIDALSFPLLPGLSKRLSAALVQGAAVHTSVERVHTAVLHLQQSIQSALVACDGLLGIWEQMHPHSPVGSSVYSARVFAFEQERITLHFLVPLWEMWRHSLLRSVTDATGQELHRILFFRNALVRIQDLC